MDNLHTLLEQEVYDIDTFLERSNIVKKRIADNEKNTQKLYSLLDVEKTRVEAQQSAIPKIQHVIDVYDKLNTAKEKNDLLKQVVEKNRVYKR